MCHRARRPRTQVIAMPEERRISGKAQSPGVSRKNWNALHVRAWVAPGEETATPSTVLRPRVRPPHPAGATVEAERPLPRGPARGGRDSRLGVRRGRGGRTWNRGDVAAQVRPTATAREAIAGEGHQGPLMTEHPTEQPLHRATPPAFHGSGRDGVREALSAPHWSWICWLAAGHWRGDLVYCRRAAARSTPIDVAGSAGDDRWRLEPAEA